MRAANGIVQTKSAAVHCENRIAELYQAGADAGNLRHSRMLFPQMLSVACRFIDLETTIFLSAKLPNTGLSHIFIAVRTNQQTTEFVTKQL